MPNVFSIGYGSRSVDEILRITKDLGMPHLVDVRSSPYSKFAPLFNREPLKKACDKVGLSYVFMGDQLGGKPKSNHCYNEDGRVNYNMLEIEPYFLEGMERLDKALAKGLDLMLMCSELRPEQCHRSKLIGKSLLNRGVAVKHFDESGKIVQQEEVINRITGGQQDLFGESPEITHSRGMYQKPDPDV
jgi:uncharacterized protein (DUF488 family)